MDYILLILVIILFMNKQYNDLWKKDIYNKKNFENRKKFLNSNYEKTNYNTDLMFKEEVKNINFKDRNIRDIGENEVRNSNTKGVNTFIREIVKIDDSIDSSNEKQSKKLNEKIEIKKTLKSNNEENDKQDIYNKNISDNKKRYYDDLRLKENIKNNTFNNVNLKGIESNKVMNSNFKQLNYIIEEIVKIDDSIDSNNEKIEIKKVLKDTEENNNQDIDIILKEGVNISNNNQQYSLVDLYIESKECGGQQEFIKEKIIGNINNKLVDNLGEERIINDKDILHKENNDNKKIIKEYDIEKESSKSKNISTFNDLKNKYKGVNVYVVISGIGILEGEIVFDFPNIIALKNKDNIIIFIDESKVLSIF